MKHFLFSLILPWLPKNWLSYWVGRLSEKAWPAPLGPWLVRWFAKRYKIRLDEAEMSIGEYKSINALFTRRLKAGVRPRGEGLLNPADARITEHGRISAGILLQIKGKSYRVADLLGSEQDAARVEGGYFITYYLCPTDYHRVHSPMAGQVLFCRHIPGQLWPVNSWSVSRIENLFSKNERTITALKKEQALAYVVMVGATNVGKITMTFDANICTNQPESLRAQREHTYGANLCVEAGDELGVFNMGSTVVVLYNSAALLINGSTGPAAGEGAAYQGGLKSIAAGPCQVGASLFI